MKYILTILVCLFFAAGLQSQTPPNITALEYWFDGNLAERKQVTLTPNQTVVYSDLIDASALSVGVHSFQFRAVDSNGKWCAANTQTFYKAPPIVVAGGLISGIEYWIDSDIANRIYLPQTPQQTVSISKPITIPATTTGLHTFNLRTEDNDGRWSPAISQLFYQSPPSVLSNRNITAYRYWFDEKISKYTLVTLETPVDSYQLTANITVDATLAKDKKHTFNIQFEDELGQWSMPDSAMFYYDSFTRTWTPDGTHPNDWTYANNWTPMLIPPDNAKVIIPKSSSYPVLQAATAVDTIQFGPGAELGRQDLLTYKKAFVALNFSSSGLARNQWHLLSMPIGGVVAGDFSFGGYPYTFLRKFIVSDEGDTYQQAGWQSYSSSTAPLAMGEGFALWVNDSVPGTKGYTDYGSGIDEMISSSSRNYGLGQLNGIIQLPYFEDQTISDAHRIHKYENGSSYFYPMNTSTPTVTLGNNPSSCTRGADAYLLASSSMSIPVNFGQDGSGYFALVGNPFMSTIDFQAFCTANTDIKNSYQIWTGSGFSAYDPDGVSGYVNDDSGLTQYIAPMQSFFVEKSSAFTGKGTMNFDLTNISATVNSGKSRLRSSSVEDKTLNKLNITASNKNYKVLTFIAKREYGSDKFSDADSRKIIPGMSDVPEIYTLKDSEKGSRVAVGSNIINSDTLVPLGLATAYKGELLFTFTGMDRYDSQITFIDLAAQKEIDLTGKESYDYRFDYTPKQSGNEINAEENRFFVQIRPAPTGIETVVDNMTRVYSDNHVIYAVSSLSNLIRQMAVYNLQGDLLYSNKNINASHYAVALSSVIPEICLVRLVTEQGVRNVKLMMNR